MIVVANRIPVAEVYESDFENRFRERENLVDNSPGFIRNEVLRPMKGEPYIIKTYWEDMASFEAWTKSEAFKKAHSKYPPKEMFAGPNELEIHEVLFTTEKP